MKERPILYSAAMALAVLDGRKTQTRRVVKDLEPGARYDGIDRDGLHLFVKGPAYGKIACPYGVPGDRLWGKETYRLDRTYDAQRAAQVDPRAAIFYEAGGVAGAGVSGKLRPSIFMPRWASRILTEVEQVRVERLNDISEEDALAEGVVWSDRWKGFIVPGVEHPNKDFPVLSRATAREMYAALWDTINGSGQWLANPWVWAVTSKRIDR